MRGRVRACMWEGKSVCLKAWESQRMSSSSLRVQEVMSHAQSSGTVMQTIGVGELLARFHVPAVIDFMSLDVEGVWASQQMGEQSRGGEGVGVNLILIA